MGLEIIWSKNASNTLELVHKKYSQIVGISNSQLFIENLVEKINHLKLNPYIGKSIYYNKNNFHYLIHSHYKIIYQIRQIKNIKKVFILLIFDTRQNPDKLIEQLKNL